MSLNDSDVMLGMLNDTGNDEFDNELQDEEIFDAHPHPGIEIGMHIKRDLGSGSFAQDGRLEVAEDKVMMNGESQVGGPASEDGQSEIGWGEYDHVGGSGLTSQDGQSEIGRNGGYIAEYGPSEIGHAGHGHIVGPAALSGQSEIGRHANIMAPFESFMLDDVHIGAADRGYGSEIGAADRGYGDEIGAADRGYGSEIGGIDDVGSAAMYGPTEIGSGLTSEEGQSEIGAAAAVVKVVEKARDNRQPPPPMRAVDVDDPTEPAGWDDELMDTLLGAAAATGNPDPFPLTSQFMQRAGAGMEPRYVRVDTEASYKQFRTENSPELAELRERLEAHIADPEAHSGFPDELSDDIDDLVHLGAETEAAEAEKRVEMWMPKRFDGLVTAWREGDFVCASLTLPGGEIRICTSLEPLGKCVQEMSHHAAQAGVPASTVVGVLPAMGCVLGAGTALKEMASAAKSIVQRPEMASGKPFMVRVEPKVNPALSALAMLVMACRAGVTQACDEWQRLGALCPAPVKQAMMEAVQIAKAAA